MSRISTKLRLPQEAQGNNQSQPLALLGVQLSVSVGIVFRNESLYLRDLLININKSFPCDVTLEILGIDNNSSDQSAEIFALTAEELNLSYSLVRSDHNSMAHGRAEILKIAKNELVYFIDADVRPNSTGIRALLLSWWSSQNEPTISAWSGPLIIPQNNSFQKSLRLIQGTWLGNFGSPQMKTDIPEGPIAHAPTANLLVRRSKYLEVGSFDQRFKKTGEDLEIHLRLAKLGSLIRWVPTAYAEHDIARTPIAWLKKCQKYGLAQTQIAKILPELWLSKRCLPIWLLLLVVLLSFLNPGALLTIATCYFLTLLYVSLRLDHNRSIALVMLLFTTHLSYLSGEVWGIFKKLESPTIVK